MISPSALAHSSVWVAKVDQNQIPETTNIILPFASVTAARETMGRYRPAWGNPCVFLSTRGIVHAGMGFGVFAHQVQSRDILRLPLPRLAAVNAKITSAEHVLIPSRDSYTTQWTRELQPHLQMVKPPNAQHETHSTLPRARITLW